MVKRNFIWLDVVLFGDEDVKFFFKGRHNMPHFPIITEHGAYHQRPRFTNGFRRGFRAEAQSCALTDANREYRNLSIGNSHNSRRIPDADVRKVGPADTEKSTAISSETGSNGLKPFSRGKWFPRTISHC